MADHLQALAVEQHEQDIAALRGQVDAMGEYQTVGPVTIDGTGAGVITVDTWHNVASGFAASWAPGASGHFRYRLLVTDNLQLDFSMQAVGTKTDGTVFYTLPAGWIPAAFSPRIPAYASATGTESAAIQVDTSGNVMIYGIGGTTASRVDFSGLIPMS